MFEIIGYRWALVETLDEYLATGQMCVRIREHDVVPLWKICRKFREIGSFQSHVNLRKNRFSYARFSYASCRVPIAFELQITQWLNPAQMEWVTVWIISRSCDNKKTAISYWFFSETRQSYAGSNESQSQSKKFESRLGSNEISLGLVSKDTCGDDYLIFHYAREFINAIRETKPMQIRNQARGTLGKTTHYHDVPSEANIECICYCHCQHFI